MHAHGEHARGDGSIGIDVWMPVEGWNGRFQACRRGRLQHGQPELAGRPASPPDTQPAPRTGVIRAPRRSPAGASRSTARGALNWPLIQDFSYRRSSRPRSSRQGGHLLPSTGSGRSTRTGRGAPRVDARASRRRSGTRPSYDGILAAAPRDQLAEVHPRRVLAPARDARVGELPRPSASSPPSRPPRSRPVTGPVTGWPTASSAIRSAAGSIRSSLVGTSTPCGTISAADANVVAKIVQGPRATNGDFLWFGLTWGSSFSGLANTTATRWCAVPDRARPPRIPGCSRTRPFPPERGTGRPRRPLGTTSCSSSPSSMYSHVIGTDDPDLSGTQEGRREADRLARSRRPADLPAGHDRLLRASQATSFGGRAKTREVRAAVPRPRCRALCGWPRTTGADNPLNALVSGSSAARRRTP